MFFLIQEIGANVMLAACITVGANAVFNVGYGAMSCAASVLYYKTKK